MSIRSSEEYENEGRRLLSCEQPQLALHVFEEGIRRFPGDSDLKMGSAMAFYKLGEHNKACEILEEIRQLSASTPEILEALTEVYLARGFAADALHHAKEAMEHNPGDSALFSRLGRIFYSRRYYKEALAFYEMSVEVSPNWSEAWFGLGACQWLLRLASNAQASLRRAIELEPSDWQARQFLGCVLCDTGHKDEAREIFESIPLDVSWQLPALERLIAIAWWPVDDKRLRQLQALWRKAKGVENPITNQDVLDDLSRKLD